MSLLERILDSFLLFCYPMLPILCCRYVSISAEFRGFRGKKLKKSGEKFKKCRVLGPKISDFLGTNLRTFDAKPPYFVAKKSDVSGFPAGNAAKIPLFPILRYLGPRLGVVASVALLSPLTTGVGRLEESGNGRRKILHTRPVAPNPRHVYGLGFHPSFSRHGND